MIVVTLAAVGCQPTEPEGAKEGTISYADAPTAKGPHHLTLDIRVPEGSGPFPTIVFIHGGGWMVGDLTTYDFAIQNASDRGFVGVTINYRLAHEDDGNGNALSPWPAQIQDVRCALRWVAVNAAAYKIDTGRVATVGDSAGGQLAMMAGYAQNDPTFEPDWCPHKDSLAVKAVVSIYGVNDLTAVYETTEAWLKPFITRWLHIPDGAMVTDYANEFASANPTTYLPSGPAIPSHLIQGTLDTVVLPQTQRGFLEAALGAGQDVTIEYQEGVGHDGAAVSGASNLAMSWLSSRL